MNKTCTEPGPMTSTRAPIDYHAEAELRRRIDAENPHWEMMYKALLSQLSNYVDIAVAQALEARGFAPPPPHYPAPPNDPRSRRTGARPPAHDTGYRSHAPEAPPPNAMMAHVPPWLQPFGLPDNVRFTRTPDHYLRTDRPHAADPAMPPHPEEHDAPMMPEAHGFDPDLPAWRRPFTLPPNVKINRTPERRSAEQSQKADQDQTGEAYAEQPDTAMAAIEPLAEAATPEAPAEPVIATGWFGIIHTDAAVPPRQADEQDNADAATGGIDTLLDAATGTEPAPQPWALSMDDMIAALLDHAEAEPEPAASAGAAAAPVILLPPPVPSVILLPPPAALDDADTGAWLDLVDPMRIVLEQSGPAPLPVRPTGIASPEDARAFAGPARTAGRGRAPLHGLGPFEQSSHVNSNPDLWEDPPLDLLIDPPPAEADAQLSSGALEQNARLLEGVLEEFGVRGEIIDVRPGPVVTLYELEPAPGTKSSRVIGLSDDIARSMSAVSARVAVVQGRNVIGIELPNQRRETVYLRELFCSPDFTQSKHKLAIALGKTIGGEAVIVDLARMPHLLVAGTTGSGKSVAINTMILSILYRLKPEECRLIMIDPKMLELSIYEGIPHLLTPVVTDPKKAVVALKWAVREMEDRYKKMSKVGVRNIDGFNVRVSEAAARDEVITRTVQTGFNRETGEPIFETEEMELSPLPYIVVIVDEMADLMMVAGKDIEGAIQRLAQMARAAGIHLIMATQRPSVDVITGTIKANFPTRISFQVTSKIDSRTILGEQGAEQLLGQGDMLHMAGGGRISRVHGPFVSDGEVEKVVAHLKLQGHPAYLDVVVAEEDGSDPKATAAEGADEKPIFERGAYGEEDNDLYEQAVKVVLRDKKCSTSYIQRRLQVGYNKAASLVERMEKEGLVGQANNAGKREILVYSRDLRFTETRDDE